MMLEKSAKKGSTIGKYEKRFSFGRVLSFMVRLRTFQSYRNLTRILECSSKLDANRPESNASAVPLTFDKA